MAEIKWIRVNVDMFDNSKIKFIRKLPSGNDMVLFWVMLLTKAGKSNSNGYIMLTENIPYDPEMLANEFNFELNTVKMALESFIKLNMVEIDGGIYLPGWSDHQNIDGLEKIREQNRKRVAEHRERKKNQALLPAENDKKKSNDGECNVTERYNETLRNGEVTQQNKNKNKNKNKDIDKDILLDESNEYRLAAYLFKYIKKNNPSAKEPNLEAWSKEFDKMLRIDKRELEDVKKVIAWCQQDSFWLVNILSPKKLREKYEQLFLKMKTEKAGPKKNNKNSSWNLENQREMESDLEQNLLNKSSEGLEDMHGKSVKEMLKETRGK